MSLLKELIKEMDAGAVTAAHDVAGGAQGATGLFGGGVVRRNKSSKKKRMKEAYRLDPESVKMPNVSNKWSWRIIGEMMDSGGAGQREETTFDPADVISKLKDAEKRVDAEDDTVPFGMEDEEGNLVKVYVRAEQADEFESTLASMLAGDDFDEDEDGASSSMEIAEVLFQLKDKFDIVDVEWPEIAGDEEEEQGVEGEMAAGGEEDPFGGEGGMEGGEGDDLDLGGEGGDELDLEGEGDDELDLEGEGDMEAEGGAESALNQVIDMLKSQAEAQKAESEARAKEAEARTAEANANAAASKVSQEEQILDMEAHNDQVKAEEEEAKRLAQLAKWKHDQARGMETKMAEEEEERVAAEREANEMKASQPISVQSLADELIRRLQGSIR